MSALSHVDSGQQSLNEFRRSFRSWLEENSSFSPLPSDPDERFSHCLEWQQRLFAGGWGGINWPEAYGGRGATPAEQFVFFEELARAGAPPLVNQPGLCLVGPTLIAMGSEELKQRFLPGIIQGTDVWCQGFSETEAGSDLAGLSTTAERDGDHFIIRGHKVWTSFAQYARYVAMLAREPGTSRHEGVSMFIVDLQQPGIEIQPTKQITGEAEFSEVRYTDVITPASWAIGGVGQGWRAAMALLEFERSDQGFMNYAPLKAELSAINAHVIELNSAGNLSTATFYAMKATLADLLNRVEALRGLNLVTIKTISDGNQVSHYGSVVKLFWSRLAKEISELRLVAEEHGAAATPEAVREYFHSLSHTIAAGTSEIQKNVVAERLLGLPRS